MNQKQFITPIAHIQNGFSNKFGIPRQSNLVQSIGSTIVFTPKFRQSDALRGLSEFSYIWLIWGFSESPQDEWAPTVRPPRLGGNQRKGVFATRSPFRPNGLGLSSVRIDAIQMDTPLGPIIHVYGADLMDGTPIYDIKPYIPTDCHQGAICGFADDALMHTLNVNFPEEIQANYTPEFIVQLTDILALDPRPAYQDDPQRVYGFEFGGHGIKFTVNDKDLYVVSVR